MVQEFQAILIRCMNTVWLLLKTTPSPLSSFKTEKHSSNDANLLPHRFRQIMACKSPLQNQSY